MLYTNTSTGNLKFYNGSAWVNVSTGLTISADTTPQLGGNLDTNNKEIVTVSNRDLVLAPNGTGAVEVKGNTNSGKLLLNCENNSHHVFTFRFPDTLHFQVILHLHYLQAQVLADKH